MQKLGSIFLSLAPIHGTCICKSLHYILILYFDTILLVLSLVLTSISSASQKYFYLIMNFNEF